MAGVPGLCDAGYQPTSAGPGVIGTRYALVSGHPQGSAGALSALWRHNLQLDPVRVFKEDSVVVRPTCVGMAFRVEHRVPIGLQPGSDLVDLLPGFAPESQMIQADSFAVVAGSQVLRRGRQKTEIRLDLILEVADATSPTLMAVAEKGEERGPERDGSLKVANIQLDVVEHGQMSEGTGRSG